MDFKFARLFNQTLKSIITPNFIHHNRKSSPTLSKLTSDRSKIFNIKLNKRFQLQQVVVIECIVDMEIIRAFGQTNFFFISHLFFEGIEAVINAIEMGFVSLNIIGKGFRCRCLLLFLRFV